MVEQKGRNILGRWCTFSVFLNQLIFVNWIIFNLWTISFLNEHKDENVAVIYVRM